jgi:CDP-glycerol glycerophosphotransferase
MFTKNNKQIKETNPTLGFEYPIENIPYHGKYFIYGIGSAATAFLAWMYKCRPETCITGFIDSEYSGSYMELPVYALNSFIKNILVDSYDEILIVSSAHEQIEQNICLTGLKKYRVITPPIYLLANILINPEDEKLKYHKINPQPGDEINELHLFFGENMGKFIGNNKYFYLYLKNKFPDKVYWVAEDKNCIKTLKENNISVIDAKHENFITWLNQASHFYFDKLSWPRAKPWLRYCKAKKIHTSHGVGLKYTELMEIPEDFIQNLDTKEMQWLYDNILDNDLLLSTSTFYATNVSEPGYGTPMDKISLAGYPKNDVLYHEINGEEIFTDQSNLKFIRKRKDQGYKIVCYTPTCRHMNKNHQDRQILDLESINNFCKINNVLFILKSHGLTDISAEQIVGFSHIVEYNNECDVYPLLRDTDVLISDYSSIFMDFLHVRKPIIFYPYDFDEFISLHNPLQFDYYQMTPGPKAFNCQELLQWLNYFLIDQKDEFKEQREKIFSLAYSIKKTGASARLFSDMQKMGLI